MFTLTATPKAYRKYGRFWTILDFPPYFLGGVYYFLLLFTAKPENYCGIKILRSKL
jgi:hypothetical protein